MSPDRGPAPDRRFPAAEHLRARLAFQAVFRDGAAFHGSRLVLFILHRDGIARRVGIVASRRVGGAVLRNRSKRLLREAYRHVRERLPTEGLHMVLVARRGCHEARMQDVLRELEMLLGKAGLLEAGGRSEPGGLPGTALTDPPTTTQPPSS